MSEKDKNIYIGKVISAAAEKVTFPNGYKTVFDRVRHPGGAAVVAVNAANQVCLLRHYRPIAGGWLWELPAGKLDKGESPQQTGQRELLEETGITAGIWRDLGAILSSPAVFDEKIHLYLACEVTLGTHQRDEDELMELEWIDFEQALLWAQTGKIVDAKTIIGLFRARPHLI